MSEPVRTCVGCGERAAQRQLVRLTTDGERVIFDRQRSGGRGAWLHPSAGCLEKALRRRALPRALRRPEAGIDAAALRVELTGSARKD
ncbi:YlxR family protein [Anaeromyxobacter terrae]|uniref:YlxR family protein n=1 Tax=Anaeromyxobacter terrae TaxID=2925406 RepID=UPI001F56E007|nr:YlxR family protein [Anaeromyxobacter sp. SG22]